MDFPINFYLLKYHTKIVIMITECFGGILNFEPKASVYYPPHCSPAPTPKLGPVSESPRLEEVPFKVEAIQHGRPAAGRGQFCSES